MDIEQALQRTTIVIPVFNAYEYLLECLESLNKNYPQQKLILVDDQSTDERIRPLFETYKVENLRETTPIFRPVRGWFTRAVNTGLRAALESDAEWVVCLNSDCVVYENGLHELFNCWNIVTEMGKQVGMVGSDGPHPLEHRRFDLKQEPEYTTGHCVLYNAELMRREGFRYPQNTDEVRGFNAQHLAHINSDRALSYAMNRKGYASVTSYWSNVGHHGFKSWDANVGHVFGLYIPSLGD